MADGTSDVDVSHASSDHRRSEEVLLEEAGERFADPVLVARDDRRVWDGQPEWVTEERSDREPIREPADHGRFCKRFDIAEPWILRLQRTARSEDGGHHDEQARRDDL